MKVDLKKRRTQEISEKRAYIRGLAVGLSMKKMVVKEVAELLNVSKRSILRWRARHRKDLFMNKVSTGRKTKTTERSNRLLLRLALKNKFSSAVELLKMWNERLSVQTVYCIIVSERLV